MSDQPIMAETARPIQPSEPARAETARAASYRTRFAAVYAALALVAGLGVGAFFVLLSRPDPAPAPSWATWQPSGSASAKVKQIADRVAQKYRLDNGQEIAAALPSEPKVTGAAGDVPVSAIAVRPDTSKGLKEESQIDVVPASSSYQYILCGLGTNCSIKGGKASVARHALLRREALELALYTFKYVPDVDSVSVFLPPRPDGQAAGTAVFIKKSDVKGLLDKPLGTTIAPTAPRIGKMTKKELAAVNRLTEPRLYTYEYQQAQDGSAVLIYSPLALGT